jgi:isopentenyl phosphate kinase
LVAAALNALICDVVQLLEDLINAGVIPVVAPIGMSESGETLNINADTAAGAVAGALRAKRFLLLTDVPGVLNKVRPLEGGRWSGRAERKVVLPVQRRQRVLVLY